MNMYLIWQPLGPPHIALKYVKHIHVDYPKLHERLNSGSLLLLAKGSRAQNAFFFFFLNNGCCSEWMLRQDNFILFVKAEVIYRRYYGNL